MAKTDKDFIRRGSIYRIIQNVIRTDVVPVTYDNVKFLQTLVDIMNEQSPRWPDGRTMTQNIILDSDLILKDGMIDAMERCIKTTDEKVAIVQKVAEDIRNYEETY